MNYPLFQCLLNSGDGDVQGAVQGQEGGLGAGGDQDGGWWMLFQVQSYISALNI